MKRKIQFLPVLLSLLLTSCGTISRYPGTRPVLVPGPHGSVLKVPAQDLSRKLRVLLASGSKALRFSSPGRILLTDTEGGEVVARLDPRTPLDLEVRQGRFRLGGKAIEARSLHLNTVQAGDFILVSGRPYRGQLSLAKGKASQLYLVNTLNLEDYLKGVLPSEMPSSWPPEALRAQAVAARTYALFRSGQNENPAFDLDDTTQSQVYGGIRAEEPRAVDAVKKTQGQILVYKGKPAQTFFFSNCGGHTSDSSTVWGLQIPYLRGVACHYCQLEKHRRWESEIGLTEASRRLQDSGLIGGELTGLELKNLDRSGRWTEVILQTALGGKKVKTSAFRGALGADLLKSTHFEASQARGRLIFRGLGWGHGIGLCQEGAKVLGEDGSTYKRILEHYYPGTKLMRMD